MAQAHAHDAHHDHDAHSPQHYVKIYGVLLLLLTASLAGPEIAKFMDAGTGRTILVLATAFGIAFVKAWLVIKHFMHLTVEKPIVWYMLITCLIFLVLFFAGVAPDVKNHEGTNWENIAAKAEIERALAAHAAESDAHGDATHGEDDPKSEVEAKDEPTPKVAVPEPTFAEQATDDAKKRWLMKRGEKVYAEAACVTCHRSNGAGHGPFPPLVGQQEHMGDCATTKSIITNGMAEPIEVNGTLYEQPMPPSTGLNAEDLAAVATFVRNAWGNDYGICPP